MTRRTSLSGLALLMLFLPLSAAAQGLMEGISGVVVEEDITEHAGSGSYRCRGTKGSFSEFLILTDLRPLSLTLREKLERLDVTLEDNAAIIDPAVHSQLAALAARIRAAYEAGDKSQAIARTNQFLAVVVANSGAAIPDVWRSSRDLVNAAGLLRAAGETLRFSLGLKSNPGLL